MVDPIDGRTAFEICLIQQRKDTSCIQGLAVDNDGLHLYIGLDSGFIEEYKVVYGPNGCTARICAKRQVSKKGIKSVCLLGGVGILAVLIEDGQVLLCDVDQLEPIPLSGSKSITVMAGDPRYLSPCKLATGVKTGIRKHQIEIYEICRGWDSQPKLLSHYPFNEEIKGLAWLGDNIIVSSKSTYYSISNEELKPILQPRDNDTLFTILPIPDLAVLLWEDCLAVVVDDTGQGARPPLAFDSRPLLLTQGGMCIVSVNESGGITIFDQNTSKLVQQLPFNVKSLFSEVEKPITLHHTDTPSGSTILMASARNVWMLRPVAHEAQTIQLLKSGSIEAALELAESCLTESWAEDVFAQAGLLLLQQRKWKSALDCFQRCSPAVFQPSQLFPLFPKWTRKWANQVYYLSFSEKVCLKSYWGLHRELTDLKFLTYSKQSQNLVSGFSLSMYLEVGSEITPALDDNEDDVGWRRHEVSEEKIIYKYVAEYLMKVRTQSNVHCLDGIDALVIYLLSSTGQIAKLEQFVQIDHHAGIDVIRGHLVSQHYYMALALLSWRKSKVEDALDILRKLSCEEYVEQQSTTGSVHDAQGKQKTVATYYTAKILTEQQMDGLLIDKTLKWLVSISPFRFLQVCQLCSFKESTILSIIPTKDTELQFRYLHHIVHTSQIPTSNNHYHTKLALSLCRLLEDRTDLENNEQKLPFMFAADDHYYKNPEAQVSAAQTNILHFDRVFKPRLLLLKSMERPKGHDEMIELNNFNGQELREILQHHLLLSREYDAVEILRTIEDTCLCQEQVILNCRLKNHTEALKVLAIVLRDIHAAIRYCKRYAGSEGFLQLLDMLLQPGNNLEPFYTEAVQVLNAESGNLDPMRVLDALSDAMPLSLAYPTLARMLRERTHRKRQTKITCQLSKAQNVLLKAEKYDLESGIMGQVYIDLETECVLCRKSLGGKIFYKYPSGSLVCGKCQRDKTQADVQH